MYTMDMINQINNRFKPEDNTKIGRYMDFTKFMDLIENKKLYFANPKAFEDKLEGTIPESFFYEWNEENKEGYLRTYDKVKRSYISCWNEFKRENYGLWKVYTEPKNGLCILTTVGKLNKALNNPDVKIYKVKYIDYYNEKNKEKRIEPPIYIKYNSKTDFTYRVMEAFKFDSYSYECEIRAVYIDSTKDKYKKFEVDLNELIDEIYISPFAPDWVYPLVDRIVNGTYNLNKKINKSHIEINY